MSESEENLSDLAEMMEIPTRYYLSGLQDAYTVVRKLEIKYQGYTDVEQILQMAVAEILELIYQAEGEEDDGNSSSKEGATGGDLEGGGDEVRDQCCDPKHYEARKDDQVGDSRPEDQP